MDKSDLGAEVAILESLDLTKSEKKGVQKFLTALATKMDRVVEDISEPLSTEDPEMGNFYLPLKDSKQSGSATEAVNLVLEEFLSCYMLLGYDLQGNVFRCEHLPNELTQAAVQGQLAEVSQFQLMSDIY